MNIGEVSKKAALPAKTIRYYEDIGLITPLRDPNGYRCFRDADMHKLERPEPGKRRCAVYCERTLGTGREKDQ